MKSKVLLASLLLLFGASTAFAEDDLATVLKEATAENKKAAELGFEWRDTGKFIKKAADEKDAKKAMKLAKKALKQAKDAQLQAEAAKKAGPVF
ncbi:MAG: hypothetical protein KAH22_04690 [Thiotrichaceae bacterium]|nr:hypothetical protein [Thiotrichaceae bacterium]